MVKIALDAGHGLNTAGKQTPDGIKEWTLNDKVRDKVVELLNDYDVEFIFTDYDEGETDESLRDRLNMYLNEDVDVFISIHHNAFSGKWNKATGVEVYTDNIFSDKDMELANCIYDRLAKYTGLKGRGIKTEDWYVINQDRIPAILVEGGFMDSEIDYGVITSNEGQLAYAKAIAEGLIEFLKLKKKIVKGWKKDDNGWWYQYEDGNYPKSKWLKLDAWYYFNKNGYALKSIWKKEDNNWYYFDKNCRMVTSMWVQYKNKWYYFNKDGEMATYCYVKSEKNDIYYWVDKHGVYQKKWDTISPNLEKYKLTI